MDGQRGLDQPKSWHIGTSPNPTYLDAFGAVQSDTRRLRSYCSTVCVPNTIIRTPNFLTHNADVYMLFVSNERNMYLRERTRYVCGIYRDNSSEISIIKVCEVIGCLLEHHKQTQYEVNPVTAVFVLFKSEPCPACDAYFQHGGRLWGHIKRAHKDVAERYRKRHRHGPQCGCPKHTRTFELRVTKELYEGARDSQTRQACRSQQERIEHTSDGSNKAVSTSGLAQLTTPSCTITQLT